MKSTCGQAKFAMGDLDGASEALEASLRLERRERLGLRRHIHCWSRCERLSGSCGQLQR